MRNEKCDEKTKCFFFKDEILLKSERKCKQETEKKLRRQRTIVMTEIPFWLLNKCAVGSN